MYAVQPLPFCPHLEQVAPVPERGLDCSDPCEDCGNKGENWVCLICYKVRKKYSHMIYVKTIFCHKHSYTSSAFYLVSLPLIMWQLPPWYLITWIQHTSTSLRARVSTSSQTLSECSHWVFPPWIFSGKHYHDSTSMAVTITMHWYIDVSLYP